MSAHARFPVDSAARIAPDKLDDMADRYSVDYETDGLSPALRQAAHDARTLEALTAEIARLREALETVTRERNALGTRLMVREDRRG